MRPSAPAGIAIVAALAAALAWSLQRKDAPEAEPPPPVARDGTAPTSASGTFEALQQTPQAQAYRERQRFEFRARDFAKRAASMGTVARDEEALAIERELVERERNGEVSAGESMLLRVALIDATSANDAERMARSAEMIERYRMDAERREAAWVTQLARDPRFNDYKARERNVVAEVMTMPSIPGGLTRDEYLRRRLQQERENAYGASR